MAADLSELFPPFKSMMPYQAQILARMMQNDYIARIADTGIAPAQAYVLGELWFDEPLSQVELARRLDIGKATIGQTLNRLERAGVIERRRVSTDRRVIMIHLTEKGRSLRGPLRNATEIQMAALANILGEADLAQLTELLIRATTKIACGFAERHRPGLTRRTLPALVLGLRSPRRLVC